MPAQSPAALSATEVAALSFEEALAELDRIVRGLEGGQQKLEDAITAYERGTLLRRHCEAKLAEAEMRVQMIVERADGSLGLTDGPEPPAHMPLGGRGAGETARRGDAPPARNGPQGPTGQDIPF
jgi:exodeoxyribonuclease VII small subunit